ncbi:MAG: hypothetical protein CH6_2621 [Candidatus Kapaibacterium sp.]|nr:MAG: hypothetical protein CH6_2621 [Candidatus Kapabacteria bacterium]
MKIRIFLLLIFAVHSAFAVPRIFRGTVIDKKTGLPVSQATVKITQQKTITNILQSDSVGVFSLELTDGINQIEIEISKEGFLKFSSKINITEPMINYIFRIEPKEYSLPLVIISSQRDDDFLRRIHNYETTKEGKELITSISSTLGLTLKNESDIFVRSMGPATSKPVFRGLSLEYLSIYENNLPVRDLSATAPDHSTAIDPINYSKIELIRGPKLLLFANNALGGLVNLSTKNYLAETPNEFTLNATSIYESAYNAFANNIKFETPLWNFFSSGSVGFRNAEDMHSGKGVIPNTYFKSKSGDLIMGFKNSKFSSMIEGNFFRSKYGVPGGFVGAHPKGVDIDLEKTTLNFKSLYHLHTFLDVINFNFSRGYYHHIEYEKSNAIGAEFLLKNYYGNLNFNFLPIGIFNENTLGFTFEKTFNDFGGYVFTPSVSSTLFSVSFFQNIKIGNHFIDYSFRFDHKNYVPNKDENFRKNAPSSRIFNNFSFSILVMHNFRKNSYLGLNIGRNERFPTVTELYSNGPHLAAYSFEIGSSNLKKEEAFFGELSYSYKTDKIEIYSSYYWYEFTNFLYPVNTGKISVSQLLPIYQITNTKARHLGFSFNTNFEVTENLSSAFHFNFSRGINITTNSNLPLIPPAKGSLEINYKIKQLEVQLINTFAFKQDKVGEFEEPTPGYTIFSMNFRYPFSIYNLLAVINLNIDNIFNKTYYNHLSRIKSIFPEPGRNIRILFTIFY